LTENELLRMEHKSTSMFETRKKNWGHGKLVVSGESACATDYTTPVILPEPAASEIGGDTATVSALGAASTLRPGDPFSTPETPVSGLRSSSTMPTPSIPNGAARKNASRPNSSRAARLCPKSKVLTCWKPQLRCMTRIILVFECRGSMKMCVVRGSQRKSR